MPPGLFVTVFTFQIIPCKRKQRHSVKVLKFVLRFLDRPITPPGLRSYTIYNCTFSTVWPSQTWYKVSMCLWGSVGACVCHCGWLCVIIISKYGMQSWFEIPLIPHNRERLLSSGFLRQHYCNNLPVYQLDPLSPARYEAHLIKLLNQVAFVQNDLKNSVESGKAICQKSHKLRTENLNESAPIIRTFNVPPISMAGRVM